MQILMGLVVAFWLFWPIAATGAANDFVWDHPGRDPFTGSIGFAVNQKPMPQSAKVKLLEVMERANVKQVQFKQAVEASSLSAEEKAKVIDCAKNRSFLAKEHLEECLAAHKPVLEALLKEIDSSVYKPGKLSAGERCDWMVFGKNTVKQSVVFRPAKGEPQELAGHFFEVDLGGGSKVITFRPLVCNNLCFRAVGFSLTQTADAGDAPSKKEIAKDLASGGPPDISHTLVINVWSIARSKPEGRALLEQLASGVRGKQSRDLGGQIIAAAAAGKISRVEGNEIFKVEFFDTRPEAAKRERGWVSASGKGRPTIIDLPLKQVVETVVVGGEGKLAFAVRREEKEDVVTYAAPAWVTENFAVEIHAPRGMAVAYPVSGSLKTCGPATLGRCGGEIQSPTMLFKRVSRPGATHFHFVVR